jgi:hypothetical protein
MSRRLSHKCCRRRPTTPPRAPLGLLKLEAREVPATFTVNTNVDTTDAGTGLMALRQAIIAANASSDPINIIELQPNTTYNLTTPGAGEDNGATGDLDIKKSLIINGRGSVVDGGQFDRVFDIHGDVDNEALQVTMNDLTIQNGTVIGDSGGTTLDGDGGGIRFVATLNTLDFPKSLTLSNCNIQENLAEGASDTVTPSAGSAQGGGIYLDGVNLSMTDSTLSGNAARGGFMVADASGYSFGGHGYGGGLFLQQDGSVTLTRIKVFDNTAVGAPSANKPALYGYGGDGRGGGLYTALAGATFSISDSEFTGNSAFGGGGEGITVGVGGTAKYGGMGVEGGGAEALRCTFAFNTATGGGVSSDNATSGGGWGGGASVARMDNCTVAGNSVQSGDIHGITSTSTEGAAWGGGVYGATSLFNCTVAGNTATGGFNSDHYEPAQGGGIYASGTTLYSTLVVNNTISPNIGSNGPDVYGGTSNGHNLIGNGGGAGSTFGSANNDLVYSFTAPVNWIVPLADNGGPTRTIALLPGSPAIDAGANVANGANLSSDQRGLPFARNVQVLGTQSDGDYTDIGAFEMQQQSPPLILGVVVNDGAAQRSEVTSITVTFSTIVTLPANPADAFQLVVTGTTTTVGLTADTSLSRPTQTVVRLTFSGSQTEFTSLKDGMYTLTVFAGSVTNSAGVNLDGDHDGVAGGNYISPTDHYLVPGLDLYRIFGDANGDGVVDQQDLGIFRGAFNTSAGNPNYLWYLDWNNDGNIDQIDLGQFRLRFNQSVFP